MDCSLFGVQCSRALGDGYADAVQHVVAVGLDDNLHAVSGHPRQKTADSRLTGRVQVGLRVLHKQQSTRLSPERRDDNRQRIRDAEASVRRTRPLGSKARGLETQAGDRRV